MDWTGLDPLRSLVPLEHLAVLKSYLINGDVLNAGALNIRLFISLLFIRLKSGSTSLNKKHWQFLLIRGNFAYIHSAYESHRHRGLEGTELIICNDFIQLANSSEMFGFQIKKAHLPSFLFVQNPT